MIWLSQVSALKASLNSLTEMLVYFIISDLKQQVAFPKHFTFSCGYL